MQCLLHAYKKPLLIESKTMSYNAMLMINLQPINAKYLSILNRYYKADRAAVNLVDEHSALCDSIGPGTKGYETIMRRAERREELAFNKAFNAWDQLPAREQNNFNKQYRAEYGYDCQLMGVQL